ncbi:MAG: zf-TFIIB domain-containing protein [Pyrinomonadaceae bacterium]
MSDIFDDRRKGLEEEYFHRKNKEAMEKLRAQMAVAEEAKQAGTSSMQCPRCDGVLKPVKFEEVEIDTCDKCGGVWLDSGELEQVTKREGGWFGRLWKNWKSD